ncbi:MAG: beta-propeller domain-containing protein [Clostridiales bacterium]|nr:beta-propeller domain-containing protein [Clostridiales bacterium]
MEDWKKKIKDSAGHAEIPDSLKPENIQGYLNKNKKKKKVISFYRTLPVLAGAAAVVLALVISRDTGFSNKSAVQMEETAVDTVESAKADAQSAAGAESGAEAGEERDEGRMTGTWETELYSGNRTIGEFYHTSTYEDIEEQVEKAWESWYENEEIYDGVLLEEKAEEEAQAGEAVQDLDGNTEEYSTTNLQVEGVDEGDVVKTDGTYLYILGSDNRVSIVEADTLERVSGFSYTQSRGDVDFKEMYVDKNQLILVGNSYESRLEETGEDMYSMENSSQTLMETYDLSDIKNPKRMGAIRQDGSYRTSRKVGEYIYLFSDYQLYPGEGDENKEKIPEINGEKIAENDIYLPLQIKECRYLVMSSVNTTVPNKVLEKKSLMDSGSQFYITKENIYVLQNEWQQDRGCTNVIKFRFENGKIEGDAAATLRGEVTDTFAVNEHDGYLRAVLTEWSGRGQTNRVYVLDENMTIRGMIDDIAPGETIYSARFMGNMGYFVTYRNTDPLFSVDFTNPDQPEILGELKVTGFSEYLHFYGEDRLLGLGWETDPNNGENLGLKLSMFDISDPKKVEEKKKLVLKGIDGCEGLYDYKMILAEPEKNLIGFSAFETDESGRHGRYLVFSYDPEEGFQKVLEHEMEQENYAYDTSTRVRGLYIGDWYYVVEEKKITVFDMKNGFEEVGSLELPKER